MGSFSRSTFRSLFASGFILALCVGFIVALLPAPDGVDLSDGRDKIAHAGAFAGFACLGLVAWPQRTGAVIITLLVYGLAIELAQALVPYRSADPLDWVADAVGTLAVAAAWMLHRFRAQQV